MSNRMYEVGEVKAKQASENGHQSSSEEACFARKDLAADEFTLAGCRQEARATGRRSCHRTDRPIGDLRLDLVAKHWATVLFLVKLEPLKE